MATDSILEGNYTTCKATSGVAQKGVCFLMAYCNIELHNKDVIETIHVCVIAAVFSVKLCYSSSYTSTKMSTYNPIQVGATDTACSIPCCAAVSASISVERLSSAVGASLCELGDNGSEDRAEESGAACTKEKKANIQP